MLLNQIQRIACCLYLSKNQMVSEKDEEHGIETCQSRSSLAPILFFSFHENRFRVSMYAFVGTL